MKKSGVLKVIEFFCRLGLGVLFIYSAWSKISNPEEFAYSVSRYRMLPDFTIGIFSLTMPMLELLAGLAMLFTKWLRESALLVAGMLAMFIVALVQALVRGLEISCGCFGVPSVGGREELAIALVRDLVLIVPAVWLMFRPNTWLDPLRRMPKGWRTGCLCGLGLLLAAWFAKDMVASGGSAVRIPPQGAVSEAGQDGAGQGFVVSSGPVRPGEWNVDFEGVLSKAEREQRPMVLLYSRKGCRYCPRLEECLAGESFRLWRKDRAPFLAFIRDNSLVRPSGNVKLAHDFVHMVRKTFNTTKDNFKGYPYVCVYWPQGGITNGVVFTGRRGVMGGQTHNLLVMELMSALDLALGERLTTGRKTLESIVSEATVQISARAEGTGGTVTMTPKDGLLPEGKRVQLVAKPEEGYAFIDWRKPDGSLASRASHLTVRGGMPIGCYTACFKSRSQCLPPVLLSPAETSLCVRVGEPVRYSIKVSEDCRPFSFQAKQQLPEWMDLNSITGIVFGTPESPGTNTVTIAVIGNDPQRTEQTVRLTFVVVPDADEKKTTDETR